MQFINSADFPAPTLDTLGLSESLQSLVRESQRRHPAPRLSLQQQLPADLGASATLAAYRVAQEGLVNALRHASATRVDIDASRTESDSPAECVIRVLLVDTHAAAGEETHPQRRCQAE